MNVIVECRECGDWFDVDLQGTKTECEARAQYQSWLCKYCKREKTRNKMVQMVKDQDLDVLKIMLSKLMDEHLSAPGSDLFFNMTMDEVESRMSEGEFVKLMDDLYA